MDIGHGVKFPARDRSLPRCTRRGGETLAVTRSWRSCGVQTFSATAGPD